MKKQVRRSWLSQGLVAITFLVTVTTSNAFAAASTLTCNTLSECQAIKSQAEARVKELQAEDKYKFIDFARQANGELKYMTQDEAYRYCAEQGAHLPSARELAKLAMNHGAKGIVDRNTCEIVGCWRIAIYTDASALPEVLYYSNFGYQTADTHLGKNYFWSKTYCASNDDFCSGHTKVIVLDGSDGDLGVADRIAAVGCMAGPHEQ